MDSLISKVFSIMWVGLALFWIISARKVKHTVRTESVAYRLLVYWAPLMTAFYLLGPNRFFAGTWLVERFVPHGLLVKAIGLVIAVFGLVIACWSRFKLGRNWSSVVQLKEDHELIESGPYRYVRHPIYTGLLLMFVGTALKVGDWRGVIAVAIVAISFWIKLRREEALMQEQFGERYVDYMTRTRALFPGVL